jgi:hypothetical protein
MLTSGIFLLAVTYLSPHISVEACSKGDCNSSTSSTCCNSAAVNILGLLGNLIEKPMIFLFLHPIL